MLPRLATTLLHPARGRLAVTTAAPCRLLGSVNSATVFHRPPRSALGAVRWSSTSKDAGGEKKEEEPTTEKAEEEEPKKEESEAPKLPLYQQLMADLSAVFESLKGAAGSAASSASSAASSGAAGAAASAADGPPPPPESGAVVVRPPSFWEKFSQQESPFFARLRGAMGGVGDAAGRVGDIFGETEQAEAIGLLKEQYPAFRQEELLEHISEDLGPTVVGAFLQGDLEVLRANCRDQAFAILNSSVQERITRQLRMDPRILHMSEPDLESVRIINGQPTCIVSFETHQLYCVRNALTGAVEEGSEDDIRAFYYMWALQLNEETEAAEKWQVTELAMRVTEVV